MSRTVMIRHASTPLLSLLVAASAALGQAPDNMRTLVTAAHATYDEFALLTRAIGGFCYDAANNAFFVNSFVPSGGTIGSPIRRYNELTDTSLTYVYASDYHRFGVAEDVDLGLTDTCRDVFGENPACMVLNPQTVVVNGITYPPGTMAVITDLGMRVLQNGSTARWDWSKRLYYYDLRRVGDPTTALPDRDNAQTGACTNSIFGDLGITDWNDAFGVLVTAQQIIDVAMPDPTKTWTFNLGRQGAFSSDGQSFYWNDSAGVFGGIWKLHLPTRSIQWVYDNHLLVGRINTEPNVIRTTVRDFSPAMTAEADQIIVEGDDNLNAGGLNYLLDDGAAVTGPYQLIARERFQRLIEWNGPRWQRPTNSVAQVDVFTPANVAIGDTFTLTATGPDTSTEVISFTVPADHDPTLTLPEVATKGIVTAWNASTSPLCTPITATSKLITTTSSEVYVTLKADGPGEPFDVSSGASGGAATFTRTAVTASHTDHTDTLVNTDHEVAPTTVTSQGNDVYFFDGSNSSTLWRFDVQGRLGAIRNKPQHDYYNSTALGTAPGGNTSPLRLSVRNISYAGATSTFSVPEVMCSSTALKGVAGIIGFKSGDFDRDNDVDEADMDALLAAIETPIETFVVVHATYPGLNKFYEAVTDGAGGELATVNPAAYVEYQKYDLNGNGLVTGRDLRIFRKFLGKPGLDADLDGDVDQADFGQFQACFTGAGAKLASNRCYAYAMDNDLDVDMDDFAILQQCISGPGLPAELNCTD